MVAIERYQIVATGLLILLAIFQCVGILVGLWTLTDTLSVMPEFIFAAIIGVFVWGFLKNIEHKLGKQTSTIVEAISEPHYKPIFRNLSIYFHRANGLPDTPESAQLTYLVDRSKRIAYLIRKFPEWFISPVKKHELEWVLYDDEGVLKRYIKENFLVFDVNISPETIGLKYADGSLIEDARYSGLLSSLGKNRFENLQIARLSRRRYNLSCVARILLVDFSANKVWYAPRYWYQLVEMGLIDSEIYNMHFWESCKRWSKRQFGYELVPNHYPESQLISKSTNK